MRANRTQCRCLKRFTLCILAVGLLPILIVYFLVSDQIYYRIKRTDVSSKLLIDFKLDLFSIRFLFIFFFFCCKNYVFRFHFLRVPIWIICISKSDRQVEQIKKRKIEIKMPILQLPLENMCYADCWHKYHAIT